MHAPAITPELAVLRPAAATSQGVRESGLRDPRRPATAAACSGRQPRCRLAAPDGTKRCRSCLAFLRGMVGASEEVSLLW